MPKKIRLACFAKAFSRPYPLYWGQRLEGRSRKRLNPLWASRSNAQGQCRTVRSALAFLFPQSRILGCRRITCRCLDLAQIASRTLKSLAGCSQGCEALFSSAVRGFYLCLYSTPPLDHARNTFITSSPRWLITLTAMRPEEGRSKGRETSLRSVDQASALISALRVVLSDL